MALQAGSRQVSELAAASDMSLPGFMKHLRALEDAGLLRRRKTGRVVTCSLTAKPMRDALGWLARYEAFWGDRLDALARHLDRQDARPTPPEAAPHTGSRTPSTARGMKPAVRAGSRQR